MFNTLQFALLKSKRFLPLFITQFLGAFNDNTFKSALLVLFTYRLADLVGMNAQILVTLAAGIFILPFFLFSATAGEVADKFEKSRLIAIIKLIEILLMVAAGLGFYWQNISVLMLVLFALGTHATFFGPLKYALLPEHLQENELIAGNGLIEAGTFLAILLGTIFGGLFILFAHGEFVISAIVILVAVTGFIASLSIPKTISHNHDVKIHFNIVKETFALLKYSRQRWDIYLCILGISWFWLFGSIFLNEFTTLAKTSLNANQNVATFFFVLFSIGLATGSLLCNKLLKGKVVATYVPVGALGMTIFTTDLYFALAHFVPPVLQYTLGQFLLNGSSWRIILDLLMITISCGLFTVPLYTIVQHRSPREHCARVIASNNVMNALFMVVGAIATMFMLKIGFSVASVFLALAVFGSLVAIYACKLLPELLIKNFFRALLLFLYRVKVVGLDNYEKAGSRVVIVANHTSFIDALLLATFLPDNLTFAVNTITARRWWIKLFMRLVVTFPVDPTNPMAIKSLIEFVQKDKRCVIFPEGRLTTTGALMKIYEGPGLVADKSAAELLPIRIEGSQLTPFSRLRGKVKIQWMPTITITIFPTEKLNVPAEIKGRKRRQQIGYQLYDIMTKVMFESSDYKKTLFTSLINAKSVYDSQLEIIEDVERQPLTYQKLIMRCFILAGLVAKATRPREHVGVLLPNMTTNVILFFALQAINRIPAMLNFSTGAGNVVNACHTAQIKTVYTSHKFVALAKLTDMIAALEGAQVKIIYLEDFRKQVSFIAKLSGWLKSFFPNLAYKLLNSGTNLNKMVDEAAVVLFTSGSEGMPKGVVLSHANIQANRFQLSACVDFTSSDKVFNALPIFHSFGLTGGMLLPLLSGVKLFLYPSPLHYRIIPELSYDTNSTILFGTDTFLSAYAKYANAYDFYSLRYVFAGAEKLREETRAVWAHKFGVRIFEGYGATETAPVMSTNTPMQNKIGTVGRFLPGIHYRLATIPGIEQGGQLSVSGPNVMKGYLLATQPGVLLPPANGWYDTGDVVTVDDTGFVSIIGRVKRFAKIAGEMVSLAMVENNINHLWPEHQHAVVNMPDAKKGERLVLVTTNLSATREELVAYSKQIQMGDISVPKVIVTVKKMPLLGTGKIDLKGVKELVETNTKESEHVY
jgi:acyl-[acyl-carrier-protein]-phospholipid O-acyltransferase / long-chain-fatty-acid--[acyl-carrier-protein] ligase